MLSHASRFRWKGGVIENFEYLGKFKEYFRKYWLYRVLYLLVTERRKEKSKNRLWKSRACVPLTAEDTAILAQISNHYQLKQLALGS